MRKKRGKRQSWHLFWQVPDKDTLAQLELFVKLSIIKGMHHTEILTELVTAWNRDFLEKNAHLDGVTLEYEKGLMAKLRPKTPVSRVLLSQYRSNGRLVINGGRPLFWTDGRRVVYNLEGCKAFFSARAA